MPSNVHIFNLIWSGQTLYILARKQYDGSYTIESINGFDPNLFPDSVRKAALKHFIKFQ